MEQLSRPLLIALAGMLALLAVWFVALRPKPIAVSNAPAAPIAAVPAAKQASAAADAARTPATEPVPATPVKAVKADGAVLRDIRRGKVVVMLFWNPAGADDVATRRALRGLDLRDGKVAVHVIPISRVARYDSITRDVTVAQSPTTLVIDRKRRTRVIVGLSEQRELAQAVGDALAGRGR